MDFILAHIPTNSNDILSDTLNQCYKHIRLVMKYPNLLKITDSNDYLQNLVKYSNGNSYLIGLLNNGGPCGSNILWRGGDIQAALSFPENQDGDIITIGTNDHILNTIVVDKKKIFYPLIGNGIMIPLVSISFQCIHVYGAKKIQILSIYLDTNIRRILAFNQQYFEYCGEIYRIAHGLMRKIGRYDIQNNDNGIILNYNKIWAANRIRSFFKFIAKKRKIKENWIKQIKIVGGELRALPGIGIDYFNAAKEFEHRQ